MSGEQVIAGGSVSLTVTPKAQLAVLPDASVTMQVTMLVPLKNTEPLGGLQMTVAPGWSSLIAGSRKVTTAEH